MAYSHVWVIMTEPVIYRDSPLGEYLEGILSRLKGLSDFRDWNAWWWLGCYFGLWTWSRDPSGNKETRLCSSFSYHKAQGWFRWIATLDHCQRKHQSNRQVPQFVYCITDCPVCLMVGFIFGSCPSSGDCSVSGTDTLYHLHFAIVVGKSNTFVISRCCDWWATGPWSVAKTQFTILDWDRWLCRCGCIVDILDVTQWDRHQRIQSTKHCSTGIGNPSCSLPLRTHRTSLPSHF